MKITQLIPAQGWYRLTFADTGHGEVVEQRAWGLTEDGEVHALVVNDLTGGGELVPVGVLWPSQFGEIVRLTPEEVAGERDEDTELFVHRVVGLLQHPETDGNPARGEVAKLLLTLTALRDELEAGSVAAARGALLRHKKDLRKADVRFNVAEDEVLFWFGEKAARRTEAL